MDNLVEKKKIGRPLVSEKNGAMSNKTRQMRAKSQAMADLCTGNESKISNSMLVAILPNLIKNKSGRLIERVCDELKSRFI